MPKNGLYPLKFKSIFKTTPWGGSRLRLLLGKDIPPGKKVGESWEIADHGKDNTIIDNGAYKGVSLHELIVKRRTDILGQLDEGESFPFIIKFIDTAERLSLQVHPDDAYARSHEGPEESGKTEAWYIIQAEPGAWVVRGVRPGINRKDLEESLIKGAVEGCLDFLQVQAGDVIFIPPGTLHAVGPGVMLLEVQQNSDLTYRVYDWGRSRQVHVEKALEVINLSASGGKVTPTLLSPPPQKRTLLLGCDKFTLELLELDQPYLSASGGHYFNTLTVIEGRAQICYGKDMRLAVSLGESVLVPAQIQRYSINPLERCRLIRVLPKVL